MRMENGNYFFTKFELHIRAPISLAREACQTLDNENPKKIEEILVVFVGARRGDHRVRDPHVWLDYAHRKRE